MIPQAWLTLQYAISQKQWNNLAQGKPLLVQRMGLSNGTVSDFLLKKTDHHHKPHSSRCTVYYCNMLYTTRSGTNTFYDIKH